MVRIRWYGPTLVLLLTVLLVMLMGPGTVRRIAHSYEAERIVLIRDGLTANPTLAELSAAFRKVAQVVEPSVVHIEVRTRAASRRDRSSMRQSIPEEFRDFFFGPDQPDRSERPDDQNYDRYNPARPMGNGSGWVFDSNGHIITNNHVIDGADEIRVRFSDGSERVARVVGTDPRTDVAVIKVDGGNVHPAAIAGEPVEQGDMVFAFGSPFRFDFSMSQGIVSAKGRQLRIIGPGGYENFIQTDAAINPGNSGGPLTNIYGQVVGMNTAIATRTGAYNGLGFAIPVAMVRDVAEQLIAKGRVSRGYLGVYINDLEPRMARTFNFSGKGVLVVSPIAGGPGERAGLKSGDIITRVDGQPVETADELRNRVAGFAPGSELTLEVFRGGQLIPVKVTIDELPDETLAAAPGRAEPEDADAMALGIELLRKLGIDNAQPIADEQIRQLRLPAGTQGVLVMAVRPNSIAAAQAINRGTVITQVMDQDVASVEELVGALQEHDLREGVRLSLLERGPDGAWLPRFVLVDLPAD